MGENGGEIEWIVGRGVVGGEMAGKGEMGVCVGGIVEMGGGGGKKIWTWRWVGTGRARHRFSYC